MAALGLSLFSAPAQAQMNTAGAAGAQMRQSEETQAQAWQDFTPDVNTGVQFRSGAGSTYRTGSGAMGPGHANPDFLGPILPQTTTAQFGTSPGTSTPLEMLPPTRLSSFVVDSGYDDNIYGLEGSTEPVTDQTFTDSNTIGFGMRNNDMLSTGHASGDLPSAWIKNF